MRGPANEASLLGIVNVILRHRTMIVGLGSLMFVLVTAFKLTQKRVYTSSAIFMATQGREGSAMSGLAAQFGISHPGKDATKSSDFYIEMLKSRRILGVIADSQLTITDERGTRRVAVTEMFGIEEPRRAERRLATIDALRGATRTSPSEKTGAVTMSVTARQPASAAALASALLAELARFNLERRQESATAERAFIEERLARQRVELRQAENRLQGFLESNRQWESSPQLTFEKERLSRDLAMRQAIATSMEQANEQTKMEQARETPLITVIEDPEVPLRPNPRGLVRDALLGFVAGAMLGVLVAFARQLVGGDRLASDEVQEFDELRRQTIGDFTHPWRLFARMMPRRGRGIDAA